MLHENHEPRIFPNARVPPLEPVIEPAHRLIAPLDLGPEVWIIGIGMIPGPHNRLNGSLRLHQHVGNVVAIPVLQAANQKSRSRDLTQGRTRSRQNGPSC